jgi:hypothetical protein
MKLESDFTLNPGDKILLTKKKGRGVVEFSLHQDPVLDNIVEMWKYDSNKGKSGKSVWLLLKDLSSFIGVYLSSGDFEIEIKETKGAGKRKKN